MCASRKRRSPGKAFCAMRAKAMWPRPIENWRGRYSMATKRAKVTEESAKATLGAGGILDRIGDTPASVELHDLLVEQIHPNPFQPRQHFASEGLEELATAIRAQGFYG